jgi:hypothetical protein
MHDALAKIVFKNQSNGVLFKFIFRDVALREKEENIAHEI